MSLCKYKSVFGDPGQGAHSVRLFGLAFVDTALTILAALLVSWKFKTGKVETIACAFLIGIAAHALFCVDTALNSALGL
jgi:hypothetical protein